MVEPQDVTATVGQEAMISCESTIPPSRIYGIVWMKDDQMLKENDRCKYERKDTGINRVQLAYKILRTRSEDKGSYKMKIITCCYKNFTKEVNLNII